VVAQPGAIVEETVVRVGPHPVVHPLTGQLVHPLTGLPIPGQGPGPGLAEAVITEARLLDVAARTTSVAEFVDVLLSSG
jgi:hypothetical protein